MDQIRVRGGAPLNGRIAISGAKNAALPLMAAGLLSAKPVTLRNVPDLADIASMTNLLRQHGALVTPSDEAGVWTIDASDIVSTLAPYELVRKMRASVLVLGPLLARFGEATVSMPGGCAIGNRPVDLHLKGLEALGATVEIEGGYMRATAPKSGLSGGRVMFPVISVGATENILTAAALAKGETEIVNAAREPEILDLARLLISMGAEIEGAGTDRILVQGKPELGAADHRVIADRIETGTYAMAVGVAGGEVVLEGVELGLLQAAVDTLTRTGLHFEELEGGVRVTRPVDRVRGVDVMTEPFPGFPTDLQAQFMTMMTVSEGASMVTETIFENRFMHVPELARMGANITVHHASALVRGVPQLNGAPVMATDLRASVSLVLAALAAKGETTISRIYHLDRGYAGLVEKLAACGADIERVATDRGSGEE